MPQTRVSHSVVVCCSLGSEPRSTSAFLELNNAILHVGGADVCSNLSSICVSVRLVIRMMIPRGFGAQCMYFTGITKRWPGPKPLFRHGAKGGRAPDCRQTAARAVIRKGSQPGEKILGRKRGKIRGGKGKGGKHLRRKRNLIFGGKALGGKGGKGSQQGKRGKGLRKEEGEDLGGKKGLAGKGGKGSQQGKGWKRS